VTVFDTSEYRRSTGPSYHNAISAWQLGATGRGVTIGIVDTGIDPTNPEFAGRISSASADVVSSSRGTIPEDDHGTNVALVAAGARNGSGIVGIAYESTILMMRADTVGTCADTAPDKGCTFSDFAIANGVDRLVQNGAKVINLSLGGSSPDGRLRNAIIRAANAGVVVIVAAGNDADAPQPSTDPNNPDPFATGLRQAGGNNVIIAGSVNSAGQHSDFANRAGSEANWYLNALGERICCVYENGAIKITTRNGQQFVTVISGTSFAAPQIAGAAALLRQAFPNLTAAQTVNLLLTSARDAGDPGVDTVFGRGILDIGRAFAPQGTLSVASTLVPLGIGDTTGTTSPAMGDATQGTSLSSIMLDSYQRAYRIDLGGRLKGAQTNPQLGAKLLTPMESVSGGNEQISLGFSVDGRGRLAGNPWTGTLRLSRTDAEVARVLAGRVAAKIAPGTTVAFGFAQGSDGLVAQVQGHSQPAFLIARSPDDDFGFAQGSRKSFALRRQLGALGLAFGAERGDVLSSNAPQFASIPFRQRLRDGVSRYSLSADRRWGNLDAAFTASWLSEDRTVLGARLHDAFGAGGADSLFLDARSAWAFAPGWRLGAAWRQGFTHARSGGLIAPGSRLTSNAWSLDVQRGDLFASGDTLALRVSQPLRVQSGGLNLDLPVAYSYETLSATNGISVLNLSPKGRELTSELAWRGPLGRGAGSMSLFYRKNPGNYANLPSDKGVAVSWKVGF
jgi:hypothetical protein